MLEKKNVEQEWHYQKKKTTILKSLLRVCNYNVPCDSSKQYKK